MIVARAVADAWHLDVPAGRGQRWEAVITEHEKGPFSTLHDRWSGKLYRGEYPCVTATKTFEIALVTIPTAIAQIVWNLFSLFTCADFSSRVRNIVRAPLYAVSIELIALATLVSILFFGPENSYEGRVYIAQLQLMWNDGLGIKDDKAYYIAPCFMPVGTYEKSAHKTRFNTVAELMKRYPKLVGSGC